jgi:adenosylmethionine-8-amino-7-oxononanoate aminotransferase
MCLSKGITGGYLPLSCVLTTTNVYRAFYADSSARGFLHSHSYTGSALACRAALATLDIFIDDGIIDDNRAKAERFKSIADILSRHQRVTNFRHLGMIWAFDIKDTPDNFARRMYAAALGHGLLIRPIGNTIYFMPPYIISDEEFATLVHQTITALEEVLS